MDAVDQRALRRARSRTRIAQRAEQFRPALFDEPSQRGVRKSLAQRGDGRQRVDYVSHGAEAHDKQAVESRVAGGERKGVGHPCRHPHRLTIRAARAAK